MFFLFQIEINYLQKQVNKRKASLFKNASFLYSLIVLYVIYFQADMSEILYFGSLNNASKLYRW